MRRHCGYASKDRPGLRFGSHGNHGQSLQKCRVVRWSVFKSGLSMLSLRLCAQGGKNGYPGRPTQTKISAAGTRGTGGVRGSVFGAMEYTQGISLPTLPSNASTHMKPNFKKAKTRSQPREAELSFMRNKKNHLLPPGQA